MTSSAILTPAVTDALVANLRAEVFPSAAEATHTLAIVDGASVPGLLGRLYRDRPRFACLYRGELPPDLAEVAPYLVGLTPEAPFTEWLLSEGWGRHWGIFARTTADFAAARRHFRRFLMVKHPDGRSLYFRYYDPRVLRVFLPTCSTEQLQVLFGPIHRFLCEDEDPAVVVRFQLADRRLEQRRSPLSQPSPSS